MKRSTTFFLSLILCSSSVVHVIGNKDGSDDTVPLLEKSPSYSGSLNMVVSDSSLPPTPPPSRPSTSQSVRSTPPAKRPPTPLLPRWEYDDATSWDLSNQAINGESLSRLIHRKNPALRELNVSGCRELKPKDFKQFVYFHDLTSFIASNTRINAEALALIAENNPGLKVLNVSNCKQLGGAVLASIVKNNPDLEVLVLSGCSDFERDDFEALPSLKKLRELDVSHTNIGLDIVTTMMANTSHPKIIWKHRRIAAARAD